MWHITADVRSDFDLFFTLVYHDSINWIPTLPKWVLGMLYIHYINYWYTFSYFHPLIHFLPSSENSLPRNLEKSGLKTSKFHHSTKKSVFDIIINMYSTQFLPIIIEHYHRCQKIFKYYPFQFNPKLERFVSISSPRGRRMFKLLNLVMLTYFLAVSSHVYFGLMPLAKKLQGFVFCLIYFMLMGSSWNYDLDKAQIQMINTCLDFEAKILQGAQLFKSIWINVQKY